jgi:hypothetical protein
VKDVKEEAKKPKAPSAAAKVTRRLSARVGDLFKSKPKHDHEARSPKVDEEPPKLDEPTPAAPLENPAEDATTEAAAVEETPKTELKTEEAPKTEEVAAPVAPVVVEEHKKEAVAPATLTASA